MVKNIGYGFALVAVLIGICLFSLRDYQNDIKKGIDLQGGTELLYRIPTDLIPLAQQESIAEDVKAVIARRFDAFGVKEISLSVSGRNHLLIQLPGADNEELERLKQQIEKSGELSFHLVADASQETPERIAAIEAATAVRENQIRAYNRDQELPSDQRAGLEMPAELDQLVCVSRLNPEQEAAGVSPQKRVIENSPGLKVAGSYITDSGPTFDENAKPAVAFTFGGAGATAFSNLTGDYKGRFLAIVLDGVSMSIASINNQINDRGILQGEFTNDEVADIVTILRAGSLPAKPELVNQRTVGALLGRESVERGTQAMMVGLLLVIIFMFLYYRAAGMVADFSLSMNLVLLLAALVIFRNTLTFPGMAGLLLTVGMAVDANILIFERIREERLRGRGLSQAIQGGFQRAFWTIFDANLTTLITAFVLFQFGTGAVKGFAVVLSIGILASFFTSLYVSRLFLTMMVRQNMVKDLTMMRIVKDPSFDFMSTRGVARFISAVLIVLGIGTLTARGSETLGIDFTGGARMIVQLNEFRSEGEVREAVSSMKADSGEALFADVQVQTLGVTRVDEGNTVATEFSIRTRHVGSSGPDGESVTETFKRAVEQSLGSLGLDILAPDAYTNFSIDRSEGGDSFRADVHLVEGLGDAREEGLTPSKVEKILAEQNYPVAVVESIESPAADAGIVSFRVISQQKSAEEAAMLENQLSSALAVPSFKSSNPFPEINTISGRVAQDMQGKVFVAIMISFLAVIFYITLRFQLRFGLAAIVALIHDIMVTLGILAIADLFFGSFLSLKINLPVIAALLTVVGYSLNDTIVIFDRIRENLTGKKRSVDYVGVVNSSINQTLSRTILTSVTTFTVVLILFLWGGEGLQAFSFALLIGVMVGTYSSIFVAGPALIYFNDRANQRREQILAEAAAH